MRRLARSEFVGDREALGSGRLVIMNPIRHHNVDPRTPDGSLKKRSLRRGIRFAQWAYGREEGGKRKEKWREEQSEVGERAS